MIVAGLHVPVMPLLDVVGSTGGVEFWHTGPIAAKVGPTCEDTTIFIDVGIPHAPADGVKVCVVVPTVEVLMVAGLHVPDTPFVDVAGSTGGVLF